MICKYCGFDIPENDRFCSNCGAEVKAETPVNEAPVNEETQNFNNGYNGNNTAYGNYQEPQGAYYSSQPGNGGFYAGNPAQSSQGYWAPPVNDKAPALKDYLKWMLLYPLLNFIPGIGFIIYIAFCIKFAIDDTYKARANFFKATLIAQIIGIVIAVLIFVVMFAIMGAATAVGFSFLEEMDPSFFMDENYYLQDFMSVILAG